VAETPPPGAWRSLAVTTAVQAMVSMALLALPAMAPAAARALGVPTTLVGVYVALCYLAAMFSSLAGGTLVRRLGAIRVSQLGLLLCAGGLALCARCPGCRRWRWGRCASARATGPSRPPVRTCWR
jgi:MFS family permease